MKKNKTILFFIIAISSIITLNAQSFFWLAPYSARQGTAFYGYIGNCINDKFSVGGLSYAAYGTNYNTELQQYMDGGVPVIYKVNPTRTVTTYGNIGTSVQYGGDEVATATTAQLNEWIAQLNKIVDSVVKVPSLNSKIIAWYIMPEECRPWISNEMKLTTAAYQAVKKYDPQNRPAFMYNPQHSDYSRLQSLKDIMDIWSIGIYPHNTGNTHNRFQVRNALEQMKKANNYLTTYYKMPAKPMIPVLEMWEDNTATYSAADAALVLEFVQHDAYAAIANGAQGILIWSMGSRSGFNTYADYYKAWAKFSNDTWRLGLRDVFFSGTDKQRASVQVTSGPAQFLFKWNTFSNTYPTLSLREIDYNGSTYILVVNSSESSVSFNLKGINAPQGGLYQNLLEETVYTVKDSTLAFTLPARGVLLLSSKLITSVEKTENTPSGMELLSSYPNPFNPYTTIQYTIKNEGNVKVEVFDMCGKTVAVLADGFMKAGTYKTVFDAKNYPSGVYICRMQSKGKMLYQKLSLVK